MCVWFESGLRLRVNPKLGAEGASAGGGVEIAREEARLRHQTCGGPK